MYNYFKFNSYGNKCLKSLLILNITEFIGNSDYNIEFRTRKRIHISYQ